MELTDLLTLGDTWAFDVATAPLAHWSRPAATAVVYLLACVAHNARLRGGKSRAPPSALLDAVTAVHNAALCVFSAGIFVIAAYHFARLLGEAGLRDVLCPPVPAGPRLPLAGSLHFWAYVFYLSKYYELVDTVLLIARGKRIIPLHAIHHAFIPLVVDLCFVGRASVSLYGLVVWNSFVHVVMYAYFGLQALRYEPPLWWKRAITQLQISQFLGGVVGASYYYYHHLRPPFALRPPPAWPPLSFTAGCDGGDEAVVLLGFLMNGLLLYLFLSFYLRTYHGGGARRSAAGSAAKRTNGKQL